MLKLIKKKYFSTLLVLASLSTMSSSLMSDECCYSSNDCCAPVCNRLYIGGFGGAIYSDSTKMTQRGTAFFPDLGGGPLLVDARGRSRSNSSGYGGVQVGYEFLKKPQNLGCSNWSISTAVEFEAYFYKNTKKGDLINDPDNILGRLEEHDFLNTFPIDMGVYLVNGVFAFNNDSLGGISPYIGVGVGAAQLSIKKADSLQVSPLEAGINHFNSKRSSSDWAFAAQAKAGLRYNIFSRFHIFAEYRFLYVDSSSYTFGATEYPTHVPTTKWGVKMKEIYNNAFAVGVQFDIF